MGEVMGGQRTNSLSEALSLPLSTLESMSDTELQQIATDAGVSVAKLREILARARERYDNIAATHRAVAQADAERNRRYRLAPSHLRIALTRMEATPEQLAEADRLETAAYQLIEEPGKADEAYAAFFGAQIILTKHRFASLCQENVVDAVINTMWDEKRSEADLRSNIPAYSKATWDSFVAVTRDLRRLDDRSTRARAAVDGPFEKFSTDALLNFPPHPRASPLQRRPRTLLGCA